MADFSFDHIMTCAERASLRQMGILAFIDKPTITTCTGPRNRDWGWP